MDLSGDSLHKRGYRTAMHASSLNESAAAGVLSLASFPEALSQGKPSECMIVLFLVLQLFVVCHSSLWLPVTSMTSHFQLHMCLSFCCGLQSHEQLSYYTLFAYWIAALLLCIPW